MFTACALRYLSELQSGFASRIGQCLDTAVIFEATAVECDPIDASLPGLNRDALSDQHGCLHVAAIADLPTQILLQCRGACQHLGTVSAEHLGINMQIGTMH